MVFKLPHRSCGCALHSDAIQSLDVSHPVIQHQSHLHNFLKGQQTTRLLVEEKNQQLHGMQRQLSTINMMPLQNNISSGR